MTTLLVDFARIIGTEFSLQSILDQLVERIVDLLPVTGAGIMLMDRAVARAHRSHHVAAVLFIHLDGFKAVNDRYGHQVGDALLVAVARRLFGLLRPGDTLARLGGDEFVALCEDMTQIADAEPIARRITAALLEPFELPYLRISATGSVGIAFSGQGQNIPAILLRDADFAMYAMQTSRCTRPNAKAATATRSATRTRDWRPTGAPIWNGT